MNEGLDMVNVAAPEVIADPYTYYGRLRESDPVYWNAELHTWFVTRHADLRWLLRNPDLFSSATEAVDPREAYPPIAGEDIALVETIDVDIRGYALYPGPRGMIDEDRPNHLEMRQALHRWFTPRAVERWRGQLQETVQRLLDTHDEDGQMEVKRDFATPLPLSTICWMLDVPQADAARLRDLVAAFVAPGFAADRVRVAVPAVLELEEYFAPLIEARGKQPGEDLISMLAEGERRNVFTRSQCVANAILLIAAGHDTTMNLICNGLLSFMRARDQWELLCRDPDALCESAVEECLRFDPPVVSSARICTQKIELGGKWLRPNDRTRWVIASANRDPRAFSDPERFDITRTPNPHVAFGGGIHHCLGAALARVEGQEALRGLARRLPSVRLADQHLRYVADPFSRQLTALHVCWN